MDAAKWPHHQSYAEGIGLVNKGVGDHHGHGAPKEVCNSIGSSNGNSSSKAAAAAMLERKTRPAEQLNCPRCNSTNTKFCYYNNYSLTQPRYFCKTCRRYWTEGGSLRNVPVGGGSRKNKLRSSSSSSSTTSATSSSTITNTHHKQLLNIIPDLNPPSNFLSAVHHFSSLHQNPNKIHKAEGQDLNLAFQVMHNSNNNEFSSSSTQQDHDMSRPYGDDGTNNAANNNGLVNNKNTSSPTLSALDLLRTGMANSSRGLDSYIPTPMPDSNTLFSSSSAGFIPLQDSKPTAAAATLSFSIDQDHHHHHHHHHGINNGSNGGGGRLFLPFGEMKQLSSANNTTADHEVIDHHHHHNKGQANSAAAGYWNAMFGGGSNW